MSKIDWDRPLEAYHEDGRCAPASIVRYCDGDYLVHSDAMPEDGDWYFDKEGIYDFDGWRVRNVTEPKADIELWAIKRADEILGQSDPRDTKAPVAAWIANAFARYVMTKEEAPVDPALLKAREIVKPWLIYDNASIDAGELDDMPAMRAVLDAIQFGRELERGEVK